MFQAIFGLVYFNVDVNYSYILSFQCSGYLKFVEKYIVNYTYYDSC